MATIRRIGILGGGPAGLYAARLLKLRSPALEVTVYERNDPKETFGFGIAMTGATQRNLADADPESHAAIAAIGQPIAAQAFRLPAGWVEISGGASIGLGRAALLSVLLEQALALGIELEIGDRQMDYIDADVLIAADGANSACRARLTAELGARTELGRSLALWCGIDTAFSHNIFVPAVTEHGMFVAHAYPYAADRSTILVETDEAAWRRADLNAMAAQLDGDGTGASDEPSLRYLENAFAHMLNGRPLLGNRTRWFRFQTVSCERWSHGRVVLLGDAAHTAHYSLGSGTKLAMEDAIALTGALVDVAGGDAPIEAAFSTYEKARRPAVERIQRLARRSQWWWESFPRRAHLPPARIAVSFMSRAGNVSLDQLRAANPELVTASLAASSGAAADGALGSASLSGAAVDDWVLDRNAAVPVPADVALLTVTASDPWGPDTDRLVRTARSLQAAGASGLRLTGPPDREALLDRLAVGERLRLENLGPVVVDGSDEHRSDLTAALVSGRADAVSFEGAPSEVTLPEADPPRPVVRVGLVVPSSNVTVEGEMAALLGRHRSARFTFHSSRMRMATVSPEELAAMNAQRQRCVDEVADAGVDALLYGCLVAVMAQGPGEHRQVEAAITGQLAERGSAAGVLSSAGALVEALRALDARRIALVTPYVRPLAERVVAYLTAEGISVVDWAALEEPDNHAVACIPGEQVMVAARGLDRHGADALVISACVQMPSLELIAPAEAEFGLPVLSAATAAAHTLLTRLDLPPTIPGAGSLLSGARRVAYTS